MVRSVAFRALLVVVLVGVSLLVGSGPSTLGTANAELQVGSIDATTWETGLQFQNLGTAEATATIEFIRQDGSIAASVPMTIPVGGSKVIYSEIPVGFVGSVRVSSTQPLSAIANLLSSGPSTAGAYTGVAQGATTVYLPVVLKNYYGWYTTFSVQNADATDATVSITFKPRTGPAVPAKAVTIKSGAMASFDQSTDGAFGTGQWIGSAVVTSTNGKKLAVVVNEMNTTQPASGSSEVYNGFTSGSTKVYVPIALNKYYGFRSSINVQNLGTLATTITVKYSDGIQKQVPNVQPGAMAEFLNFLEGHAAGFHGSATVESSGGQPIVAVVNQSHETNGRASAYSAIAAEGATAKVVAPAVYKNYYNWSSSLNVQNVGTANTTITVTYSDGTTASQPNIAPGASANFLNFLEPHNNLGSWTGGATVTASGGQKIVAVVNEEIVSPPAANPGAGDYQRSYNGTNQ